MHITHTVSQKDPHTLRLVQITDTHLFSNVDDVLLGVNTESTLNEVLAKCHAEHANSDFFLVTGDIAQQQDQRIYTRFFDKMDHTGKPFFCLAGNHDADYHLDAFDPSYSGNQVIETQHWRLILLNSSFEEQPSGLLDDADLAWLAGYLAHDTADKHVMICLHHHPVSMQSQWIDEHMLKNADKFWEIITNKAQIKAICFGHVHQAYDAMHHGLRAISAPSTSIQFKPRCDEFTVDNKPAGFRWLELLADGSIVTDVKRLDNVPEGIQLDSDGY